MENLQPMTPCYIFLQDEFENNIRLFNKALQQYFGDNHIIGYSFKTNSLPYLINCARKLGCYAETVSDTEYELAVKVGYPQEHIIYNGPIKSIDTFRRALMNHSIINIDSEREVRWLEMLDGECSDARVGIRVNFDVETLLPGQTSMGDKGGRFGFCDDNGHLTAVIARLKRLKNINVVGLHMHISSKSKSKAIYEVLTERACNIVEREQLPIAYLDIGGGFFGGGDGGRSYQEYVQTIHTVLCRHGLENLTLIVEPGASVVATAFDYLVSVVDVKDTTKNRFVITDGSRIHIDPFMRKEKYVLSLTSSHDQQMACQTLSGYTCMENDRFTELKDATVLRVGDAITFHIVGSYTMCFTPLFIQYLPRVYAFNDGQYTLVREQWTVDEYWQKNVLDL